MSNPNDPNRSPDQSDYREGYVEGERTAEARGGSNTALGFLLGIVILALLGVLAWFFFSAGNEQSPEGGETNIITPEAPAPDVNVSPPNVEQPDVNITVPSPDAGGTSSESGTTSGQDSSGSTP